jgi:DNA-binding response OmpR family regulator
MKILLADDDQDQLELRALLLKRKGFETIAFTTASEALEQAKTQRPHCAVIDLKFPTEAAGLALIRALKALDANMRLFVLTGADAHRVNKFPEMMLVEEIIVKGSSTAYLMKRLAAIPPLSGKR